MIDFLSIKYARFACSLFYRVVTALAPGVASKDPPNSHHETSNCAFLKKGLAGVFGT
jgi:hypothetical protein